MKRKEWTGDVVKRLHLCNATCKELAKECKYTAPYISMLLSGKKDGTDDTIRRIFRGVENLERNKAKNAPLRTVSTSIFNNTEELK